MKIKKFYTEEIHEQSRQNETQQSSFFLKKYPPLFLRNVMYSLDKTKSKGRIGVKKIIMAALLAFVAFIYMEKFDFKRVSNPGIIGESAIVINGENGEWLYQKNEKERVYPASTTKIMTALVAIEKGDLNDLIEVGSEVEKRTEGESSAFLQQGQTYSLKQLLSALMLPSGNDAARTIAVYVAHLDDASMSVDESISYFADLMNEKAQDLGATDTNFVNPHGLHNDQHYTTAADMALIVQEAMQNEIFQQVVNQEVYQDEEVTFHNTNLLLDADSPYYYEGANGIKTGYTDRAGRCLVSSATRNGETVITIVFLSTEEEVWSDSTALLDYGFNQL